jgi:exodeoxyribonuclease VII small subunit
MTKERSLKEMMSEFEAIVADFETAEDIDVEAASEKYKTATKLAAEIKARLETTKTEVKQIADLTKE